MTSPETNVLRQRLAGLIARRSGSTADAGAVTAAVRGAYDELAVVLDPLISVAGVKALTARAFHLAQREYSAASAGEAQTDDPFGQVSLWLEGQDPSTATDAAAAMFATFAELLAALIGEPLTTRYMRKAWPDGYSDVPREGKHK